MKAAVAAGVGPKWSLLFMEHPLDREPGDGLTATLGPQSICMHSRSETYLRNDPASGLKRHWKGIWWEDPTFRTVTEDPLVEQRTGCVPGVKGHGVRPPPHVIRDMV